MPTLDERIAEHLAFAVESGELQRSPSYGRPLTADEGWDATPPALRMPFKILKDAGFRPPEVTLFHERARMREAVERAGDSAQRRTLELELTALEQKLALRLESLRLHASL